MDPKINKEKIIAYLYGELPDEEAGEVAAYLQGHPAEAAEYESMRRLRDSLKKIQDVEVTQPVIMLGTSPHVGAFSKIWHSRFFQRASVAAIAAVIVLLLAKFTGLSLAYQNQAFTIAFGTDNTLRKTGIQNPKEQLKTRSIETDAVQQQLMARVNESLLKENEALTARLASLESSLGELKEKVQPPAPSAATGLEPDDVEGLARKISQQNMQLFSEVIRASQAQQEEYIKSLFAEFAVYMQSQRVEDLRKIETSLKSLKQESELKKLETDQVLARLIQTVNVKNY